MEKRRHRASDRVLRSPMKTPGRPTAGRREHDPSDMAAARELAGWDGALAIGLFYRSESVDRYDTHTVVGLAAPRDPKIAALKAEPSHYQI
jgi:hypothetical protein